MNDRFFVRCKARYLLWLNYTENVFKSMIDESIQIEAMSDRGYDFDVVGLLDILGKIDN